MWLMLRKSIRKNIVVKNKKLILKMNRVTAARVVAAVQVLEVQAAAALQVMAALP
jgi:hypothetical protein